MTHRHNPIAHFLQNLTNLSGRLRFATSCANGTDGDDGFGGFEHRIGRCKEDEIGSLTHGDATLMDDFYMRDITI